MSSRIKKLFVAIFIVCSLPSRASEQTHYDQGKNLASEQQQKGLPDHTAIPGFQGTQLPETTLSSNSIQSAMAQKLNAGHKSYETIVQSQRERLSFHLDPITDPLFSKSDQIVNNPLETLQAVGTQTTTPVVEHKTRHICQEPCDPYEMSCLRDLDVTVTPQPPLVKTFSFSLVNLWERHRGFWHRYFTKGQGRHPNGSLDFGGDNKGGKPSYAKHYTYVPNPAQDPQFLKDLFAIIGQPKEREHFKLKRVIALPQCGHTPYMGKHFYLISYAQVEVEIPVPPVVTQRWISHCDMLEEYIDRGICDQQARVCVSGSATRIINGFEVSRPCWQERQTYHCSYPAPNTCGDLKHKGCVQVGSRCQHYLGETCVVYEQTYECTTRTGGDTRDQLTGSVPWCLDGNCVNQGYAPNRDMAESLSKLMIFREMQKNFNHLSIFGGKNLRCRRACLDFMNCCQKKSGWGLSLGLSACDEQEKELSALRSKDVCVYVGTFCSVKDPITKTCLQKKSRYCCFDSKLARLVQEQGRRQLGLSFGDAKNPVCRGLTTDELTRIDFEKIDLSSLFSELFHNFKAPDMVKMSREFQQDLSAKIPKYDADPHYLNKLKAERDVKINPGDKNVSAF